MGILLIIGLLWAIFGGGSSNSSSSSYRPPKRKKQGLLSAWWNRPPNKVDRSVGPGARGVQDILTLLLVLVVGAALISAQIQ